MHPETKETIRKALVLTLSAKQFLRTAVETCQSQEECEVLHTTARTINQATELLKSILREEQWNP